MYICTECGLKYKNKPQYCDCGNDEFQEQFEKTLITSIQEKFERIGISLYALLFLFVCIFTSVFILFCFNPVSKQDVVNQSNHIVQQKTNIQKLFHY